MYYGEGGVINPVWHFVNGVPTIGRASIGTVLAGDGNAGAPSYGFTSNPTDGMYSEDGNKIQFAIDGALVASITPTSLKANSLLLDIANQDVSLSRAAADVLTTPDRFVSTGPTAGIGYATGAGGTVTQATSKSTGATLNTVTGEITMNGAALAAAAIVTFTLTSSAIALNDHILVSHASAGTLGAYTVTASQGAAGSCTITVRNNTAGSLSEAIVLKYSVFKSAVA